MGRFLRNHLIKRMMMFSVLFGVLSVVSAACSIPVPPLPEGGQSPVDASASTNQEPLQKKAVAPDPFNGVGSTGEVNFPSIRHLSECAADADCGSGIPSRNGGNQKCANILGTPTCFFPCDPKNGIGENQNPDCIAPENCIRLNDGSGLCIYLPGQLYGIGSYKAIIRHPPGGQCLLRFGGCAPNHICVDTKRHGSVGSCTEECVPPLKHNQTQSTCQTPNSTCTKLASGFAACIPN